MKKKKLKIAVFHLAFFYSGGGEKLVLKEVEYLRKRGYQVDIYSPVVRSDVCFPDIIDRYKISPLLDHLPSVIKKNETLEIVIACLLFPLLVRRFKDYDVIFGANQPSPYFAWLLKLFYKKPYVIYLAQPTRVIYPRKVDLETGLWVKKQAKLFPFLVKITEPFLKWIDRLSIRSADRVLVNGEYMAAIIEGTYQLKPIVCPAGAKIVKEKKIDRFAGSIKVNGYKIQKPYLLLTNRHFPQKKFEYALKAMSKIAKKFPQVKLVITGNPTIYTDYLHTLARELKAENHVLFTGYIKEKDLQKLYENACVYLYTSPEEDFGMGVIEAMGAGVPVIAWDKAGPSKTVLNGKTGFLVKAYDQIDFSKKTAYLIQNKKTNLRFGVRARKHVKTHYTYQTHFAILEKTLTL